jgi:hypothetical protein
LRTLPTEAREHGLNHAIASELAERKGGAGGRAGTIEQLPLESMARP